MGFDFNKRASRETNALNLWDIEMRIKVLHEELETLHDAKDQLLLDQDKIVDEWEKNWNDHYHLP